jgi:arylsulfatase A-like enzyme
VISGEVTEPVSQIDIMPTLLGILGYDKPYFAYGRDVTLNNSLPLTIVYDNGHYKAFTDKMVYILSEGKLSQIYDINDIERKNNLIESHYDCDIENRIKAYIQQYYEHAERKSYIVPDSVPTDNLSR